MHSSDIEFSPSLIKSTISKQLKLYKELVVYFSKKLNFIHNLNLKKKQWEILIGPTLIILIRKVLYEDKVNRKGKIKNIKIPNTFLDLNDFEKNNGDFHLIINKIVHSGFVKKKTIIQKKRFVLSEYIKFNFFFLKLLIKSNFYHTIIADVFNYEKNFFSLIKKKLNKNILFKFNDCNFRNQIKFDEKKRSYLIENNFKLTEKKKIINLSYYFFPISIIERFENYKNLSSKIVLNQKKIKKISTSTGHIYNEVFKFVIFNLTQKKNFSFYVWQHGANDINLNSIFSLFNYNISNKILCWGNLKSRESKFHKVGYQKNFQKEKYEFKKIKRIDLLLSDLAQNHSPIDINLKFYINILKFLNKCSQQLKVRAILYNNKIDKFNFDKIQYLQKKFKNVVFTLNDNKLFDPLDRKNSILIIPYHTTALYEAFLLNVPFVIFMNEYIYSYDPSFKKMKNLFYSSKIGFSSLNEIKKNIINNDLSWYRAKRRLKVIKIFKKKYIDNLDIDSLRSIHK